MSSRHTVLARARAVAIDRPARAFASPHLVVMALVFVGALVVGFLLLPDDNERIASLERDGHDRQALDILEQRFAAGDRGHRTLFQLQRLYEEKGDLPRARNLLELLAAARPRDPTVQRHLSEFYRMTQDEAGYVRTLETRLELRFAQPVCKELIGLHRRAGNFEAEQRILASCRARGYRRTDDMIRLAHLTAADGKLVEAAVLLRAVDDRRDLRLDSDRLMLFSALLEAGSADEAKRRAARWFKGGKDDGLVLEIIDMLSSGNRHELAMDLAREVGQPGDSISLAVGELMLDRDEIVAARSYLRGWLEKAKLSEIELAQRALRAALDAEDPLLAYQIAELFGIRRLPQLDLIALAEALSAVDQTAAFQAVRNLLAPGTIKENLLLAAAVELEQGKAEPARQLLSRVQVKALDEWRLALWARLMTSTGRRATAQQTLRDIAAEVRTAGGLPAAAAFPNAAPSPIARPGDDVPPTAAPSRATGGIRRAPPQVLPGDGQPPAKLIRRNRAPPGTLAAPRRSRLKRGAPLQAAPKSPTYPAPTPFPSPG